MGLFLLIYTKRANQKEGQMLHSVLVPLDGTEFAESALPAAINIAKLHSAVLHLLIVRNSAGMLDSVMSSAEDGGGDSGEINPEEEYIISVAARTHEEGVKVRTVIKEPPVIDSISEYVERQAISFIVMASHGRSGVQKLWRGSVGDDLVRHVNAPVLLECPERVEEERLRPPFKKILIPLDGSDRSERAISVAKELGGVWGAEFILVRVATWPVIIPGFDEMYAAGSMPEMAQGEDDEIRRYLDEALEKSLRGRNARALLKIGPNVVKTIIEAAEEENADLVVMASNGHKGISRIFTRSVAGEMITKSPVPVVVVHPENVERVELPAVELSGEELWAT